MTERKYGFLLGAALAVVVAVLIATMAAFALDDRDDAANSTTTIAVESPLSGSSVVCGGDMNKLYIMFREPDGEFGAMREEARRAAERVRQATLAGTPVGHTGGQP